MMINRRSATLAIHGTKDLRGKSEPVSQPMYHTSTYTFPDSDAVEGYMKRGERKHYIYQRYGNPSQDILEQRMALLEGAEDSLFLSSGMAAITNAILTALKDGGEVLAPSALYGTTMRFLKEELPRWSSSIRFITADSLYNLEETVSPETKLVFFETPTNPNLHLIDIARVANQAHDLGIAVIIDNTFASPINQRPLQLEADVVVHSATKYLGGHSDVLAGVIAGKKEFIQQCRDRSRLYGPVIDPFNVFLLLRSMGTLEVRVQRSNENAMKLASFFQSHPKVKTVHYPGLPENPYHEIAGRQMLGFGGMVTFEIIGGQAEAMCVVDSLEIGLNATSLGGIETLVSIPVITSQSMMTDEELEMAQVTPSMIRVSVGLEDIEDVIEDFENGLNKI